MRTYARIPHNVDGVRTLKWVEVVTDANGLNDGVWLATLCQTLLLNLGESPFFASYGLPAVQSVLQQVAPDYYVAFTQQVYAPFFLSLVITKVPGIITPTYNVRVITHTGASIGARTQDMVVN